MNVFAIITEPNKPILLTKNAYDNKTKREYPYIQNEQNEIKSYALCPDCNNPVQLINRNNQTTKSNTLYARHIARSVKGIADYHQDKYDDCDLKNPTRLDDKIRRKPGEKSNQLKLKFEQYIDLIITTLERTIGIKLTDDVIRSMIEDFCKNRGYEYKAVNNYNLPLAFAYMTEAKDLYNCLVDSKIAIAINELSTAFFIKDTPYGALQIKRKSDAPKGYKIRFLFSNHIIPKSDNAILEEIITLRIIEYKESVDNAQTLYTKKISIDKVYFFNTLSRRERLHQWVRDYR